jgi:hypothetical protein
MGRWPLFSLQLFHSRSDHKLHHQQQLDSFTHHHHHQRPTISKPTFKRRNRHLFKEKSTITESTKTHSNSCMISVLPYTLLLYSSSKRKKSSRGNAQNRSGHIHSFTDTFPCFPTSGLAFMIRAPRTEFFLPVVACFWNSWSDIWRAAHPASTTIMLLHIKKLINKQDAHSWPICCRASSYQPFEKTPCARINFFWFFFLDALDHENMKQKASKRTACRTTWRATNQVIMLTTHSTAAALIIHLRLVGRACLNELVNVAPR